MQALVVDAVIGHAIQSLHLSVGKLHAVNPDRRPAQPGANLATFPLKEHRSLAALNWREGGRPQPPRSIQGFVDAPAVHVVDQRLAGRSTLMGEIEGHVQADAAGPR